MWLLLSTALFAATPTEPIRIAVPDLTAVGADEKLKPFYSTHLAQLLNYEGIRTVTSADLAALMGLERQRQLMGCSDDACRAMASANLGFDGLLVGQVVRLTREYRLDVKVLQPGSGRPLAAASSSSADSDGLVSTFHLVAQQLAKQLTERLGQRAATAPAEVITRWSTVKRLAWLPAALGVGVGAAGAVGVSMSRDTYCQLTRDRDASAAAGSPDALLSPDRAHSLVDSGRTQQTLGWAGVGVGAGLLAVAGGMFLFGGDEVVAAGVAVAPQGGSLLLTGVW